MHQSPHILLSPYIFSFFHWSLSVQIIFPSFLTLFISLDPSHSPPPSPLPFFTPTFPAPWYQTRQQSAASGSGFGRQHSIFSRFLFFVRSPLHTSGLPGLGKCGSCGAWVRGVADSGCAQRSLHHHQQHHCRHRASVDMTPITELPYDNNHCASVHYPFLQEYKRCLPLECGRVCEDKLS